MNLCGGATTRVCGMKRVSDSPMGARLQCSIARLDQALKLTEASPPSGQGSTSTFSTLLPLPTSQQPPHVELIMAPYAGFDTDQIKDKARKDLLYLLEGVSKDSRCAIHLCAPANLSASRCAERRISLLSEGWLGPFHYSSRSRHCGIMASTKSSF